MSQREHRAESLPSPVGPAPAVPTLVESCNRFMSLTSRLKCRDAECLPEEDVEVERRRWPEVAVPPSRVSFHKTFSLLINMGNIEKGCRRTVSAISREEQVWQNELKDLIWLELQARVAGRSLAQQDAFLCSQRDGVPAVVSNIVGYRSAGGRSLAQQDAFLCSQRDGVPAVVSNIVGYRFVNPNPCRARVTRLCAVAGSREDLHSESEGREDDEAENLDDDGTGCLMFNCRSCTDAVGKAMQEVNALIDAYYNALALYPSCKAMTVDHPLVATEPFQNRIKEVNALIDAYYNALALYPSCKAMTVDHPLVATEPFQNQIKVSDVIAAGGQRPHNVTTARWRHSWLRSASRAGLSCSWKAMQEVNALINAYYNALALYPSCKAMTVDHPLVATEPFQNRIKVSDVTAAGGQRPNNVTTMRWRRSWLRSASRAGSSWKAMQEVNALIDAYYNALALYPSCKAMTVDHPLVATEPFQNRIKEVNALINAYYNALALYPSCKAMTVDHPLVATEPFQNRIKAMCLWYNTALHMRLKMLAVRRMMRTLRHKRRRPTPTPTPSSTASDNPLSRQCSEASRPCLVRFNCDNPSDSSNSESSTHSLKEDVTSGEDSAKDEAVDDRREDEVDCAIANGGSSEANGQLTPEIVISDKYGTSDTSASSESGYSSGADAARQDVYRMGPLDDITRLRLLGKCQVSPYREYHHEMLKTQGVRRCMMFVNKMCSHVLHKVHVTLEMPDSVNPEGYQEDATVEVFDDTKDDEDKTENSKKDEFSDAAELRRYGCWSEENLAMRLPSYRNHFLTLSSICMEAVHDYLSLRLEARPERPSCLTVKQLIHELKEGLDISTEMRRDFVRNVEVALKGRPAPAAARRDLLLLLKTYDATVESVLKGRPAPAAARRDLLLLLKTYDATVESVLKVPLKGRPAPAAARRDLLLLLKTYDATVESVLKVSELIMARCVLALKGRARRDLLLLLKTYDATVESVLKVSGLIMALCVYDVIRNVKVALKGRPAPADARRDLLLLLKTYDATVESVLKGRPAPAAARRDLLLLLKTYDATVESVLKVCELMALCVYDVIRNVVVALKGRPAPAAARRDLLLLLKTYDATVESVLKQYLSYLTTMSETELLGRAGLQAEWAFTARLARRVRCAALLAPITFSDIACNQISRLLTEFDQKFNEVEKELSLNEFRVPNRYTAYMMCRALQDIYARWREPLLHAAQWARALAAKLARAQPPTFASQREAILNKLLSMREFLVQHTYMVLDRTSVPDEELELTEGLVTRVRVMLLQMFKLGFEVSRLQGLLSMRCSWCSTYMMLDRTSVPDEELELTEGLVTRVRVMLLQMFKLGFEVSRLQGLLSMRCSWCSTYMMLDRTSVPDEELELTEGLVTRVRVMLLQMFKLGFEVSRLQGLLSMRCSWCSTYMMLDRTSVPDEELELTEGLVTRVRVMLLQMFKLGFEVSRLQGLLSMRCSWCSTYMMLDRTSVPDEELELTEGLVTRVRVMLLQMFKLGFEVSRLQGLLSMRCSWCSTYMMLDRTSVPDEELELTEGLVTRVRVMLLQMFKLGFEVSRLQGLLSMRCSWCSTYMMLDRTSVPDEELELTEGLVTRVRVMLLQMFKLGFEVSRLQGLLSMRCSWCSTYMMLDRTSVPDEELELTEGLVTRVRVMLLQMFKLGFEVSRLQGLLSMRCSWCSTYMMLDRTSVPDEELELTEGLVTRVRVMLLQMFKLGFEIHKELHRVVHDTPRAAAARRPHASPPRGRVRFTRSESINEDAVFDDRLFDTLNYGDSYTPIERLLSGDDGQLEPATPAASAPGAGLEAREQQWAAAVARAVIQFARCWMHFVVRRCDRGRGLRPRWASQGLEFLMLACDPCNTKHLTEEEFEELKSLMDGCISHVVGSRPAAPRAPDAHAPHTPHTPHTPRARVRLHMARLVQIGRRLARCSCIREVSPSPGSPQAPAPHTPPSEPDSLLSFQGMEVQSHSQRVLDAVSQIEETRDAKLREMKCVGRVMDRAVASYEPKLRQLTFKWQRGLKIGAGTFGKLREMKCVGRVMDRAVASYEPKLRQLTFKWQRGLKIGADTCDAKLREMKCVGRVMDRAVASYEPKLRQLTFKWQRGLKIGAGTFGKVYTVVNTESGQLLAMKELSIGAGDRRALQRAANELRVLEGVIHPHLVRYYGCEVHREEMLIFMELCVEGSLEALVATSGALAEQTTRRYTKQLLSAVAELHARNIAHRDIKSGNIFLTNEGHCLKLGDFGCAVKIRANTTAPGELQGFVGTQAYMAPEVFMKSSGHGRAADIWSLGCVVTEMASGKRPFSEYDSNYQIMFVVGMGGRPEPPGSLSEEGRDFCHRCLTHDPDARARADQLLTHHFLMVSTAAGA
ncbi:uncharacterized protein LOC135076427 [Ostrinia nubilalis]|uniref:uncharacterized protein LOC135076427 n=1 Tax=Ostrinia nubilalis TaxID=29057 RepID=UPI0030824A60